MTTITRLTNDNANERPVYARVYIVKNEADEARVIQDYTNRYHRVPENVIVWRNMMYVEEEK